MRLGARDRPLSRPELQCGLPVPATARGRSETDRGSSAPAAGRAAALCGAQRRPL